MRLSALILGSVLALAACGQSGAPAGGEALQAAFPALFQTSFRAEATLTNPRGGEQVPVVMVRDGQKMRMEMSAAGGASTIIYNPDAGQTYIITNTMGRTMAMSMAQNDIPEFGQNWAAENGYTQTAKGPCSGAGQTGTEWEMTKEGDATARSVCVTSDGIILSASENGQTTWQTTSVARGPQDPALFALPPGVEVLDLNNIEAQARAMMERAQQGGH